MRLVISVGESSGDYLAAHLVKHLKTLHPDIEIAGLAGPLMIQQGVSPWFVMNELNVMGLQEIISHLPRLMRLRKAFKQKIIDWQPDAFIGVDAPDFNLGLARSLRQQGVLSFHYVSPSIWAWRANRAKKIARSIDGLLTLFPFEPALYERHGLRTEFVGHPLADDIDQALSGRDSDTKGTDNKAPCIALLPGSRLGEIERHMPLLLDTASLIQARKPDARWVMPVVSGEQESLIRARWGQRLDALGIHLLAGQTQSVLLDADLAITASGTVTLEAFLLGCPQVVFYRLAASTHWLATRLNLVKSQWVSLPNILTQSDCVPEKIQQAANPEEMAESALAWLDDPTRTANYQATAKLWRERLQAGDKAARTISSWINQP